MKLVILALLFCFASPIFAQQNEQSLTGVYRRKQGLNDGYLDVLSLPGNKIKYYLFALRGIDLNNGESEGIIELNGNDATDSITFDPDGPCSLHFHFEKNRILVHVADSDIDNCGWGYGVNAGGNYIKLSGKKPNFEYGEPDYQIIAVKSFFYEDSTLTKPKKSYLIKGDKIAEVYPSDDASVSRHEHAIYTEIFNKKRLKLTYGWIARKDLKELPYPTSN